jgi:hypothetical protein
VDAAGLRQKDHKKAKSRLPVKKDRQINVKGMKKITSSVYRSEDDNGMASFGIHAQLTSPVLSRNTLLKTNQAGNPSPRIIYPYSTKNVWSVSNDTQQNSFTMEAEQEEQNFGVASFATDNNGYTNKIYYNNTNSFEQNDFQLNVNINLLPL